HREAAAAIAAGADPAEAWTDERYAEPWMHTVPRRVLVSGLQNAAKATENWMASASGTRAGARVGLPRFKKKGRSRDSFTIPAPEVIGAAGTPYKRGEPRRGVITDHRHLRLASLGTIRTYDKTSRLVRACRRGAQIRSMTISQAGGRWYASILVADPTPIRTGPSRRQRANGAVGVDLGVKHLAALSTGEVIDNGRPGARQAARLTRLQRAHARTQPGSNRRERVRRQIAALQHGIALRRAGLLHQVSTRLATDFAVVALEDLNVAGMTRSARGTLEAPGRNVAAKSGLNRAILDAGLGMLRRQLDYKTSWAGSQVKMIDRFAPSSKACSRCGTVKSTLSLAERTFECEACHLVIDRDVNAAINIRAWAVQEERGAGVELARGRRESRNGRGAAVSGPPSGGAARQGRGSVKPAPQGVGMSSRATGWSSQPPSTEGESAERGASALAR
ncbi:transposase, partial [Salmonella enterica subsp. enterica serovar Typhimurium]|nr:transposase [Salmonella enterica subsp. enterica serovar Typhimurium]